MNVDLKKIILIFLIFGISSCKSSGILELGNQKIKKEKLLYKDDFNKDLSSWIIEKEQRPNSEISIIEGKMDVNVAGGATIWSRQKIENNILIEYHRKVIIRGGENDRLSDLNQFWMAQDMTNSNLFTRSGSFGEYDSVRMYYAGIGGNRNTTTRFRKYPGNGERNLIYDLTGKTHLLEANKTYLIQILVFKGTTKVFVDDNEYFSYEDNEPLTEGYFGFRTVESHQEIDDFKIYKVEE
ncbi:DUF6250 domain-containing protein [Gramella sp. AN32]|uniref:DUF6250 domain-containing protein n=1 Tax=Christiangramia antarctica TaxID=2058158 RepID=A0ABW5X517_9FLAO|nr:DUF6250 domain-containing protein [Gramella sp. AN32]MCM4157243.1 methyltransferase [Gramella sp. AN32]